VVPDAIFDWLCVVTRSDFDDMYSYFEMGPLNAGVRRWIVSTLLQMENKDVLELYNGYITQRKFAGPVYEALLHRTFSKRIPSLKAHNMFKEYQEGSRWYQFSEEQTNSQYDHRAITLDVQVRHSEAWALGKDQIITTEDTYYHRLNQALNLCDVDALILHQGYLYLFQYNVGDKDGLNVDYEDLERRFSRLPSRDGWYFIFVIPGRKATGIYPTGRESIGFSCPLSCSHPQNGILDVKPPFIAESDFTAKATLVL